MNLGETVSLEILILVDTSASMKPKLPTVKEALLDLSISLNSRIGANQFSVSVFPGKRDDVEKVLGLDAETWNPYHPFFRSYQQAELHLLVQQIKDANSNTLKRKGTSKRSLLRNEEEYYDESGM